MVERGNTNVVFFPVTLFAFSTFGIRSTGNIQIFTYVIQIIIFYFI